jgi:hypothetical protein
MSFFLHKDCGQVPVVNGEEKEASPPLYPYGRTLGVRRACAGQSTPEVAWTSLAEPSFTEMSQPRYRTKWQAPPRTRRSRSAEGFRNTLRSTSGSSGKNESAVALRTCVASSCHHGRSPYALGRFGWRDRAGVAQWVAARQHRPGGGPPHSNVGDQLGQHVSVRLGRPGRRFSFGVEADLVGEFGDYV